MHDLVNLFNTVEFPKSGTGWVHVVSLFSYWIIKGLYKTGMNYGVAIILFAIILKLLLSPMDFAVRYMTKKNAASMAKMKPELDEVKARCAGKATELMVAQREVYKRNGYSGGAFSLFLIANMIVTMSIFFTVFASMNAISTLNIRTSVTDLQTEYHQTYKGESATEEEVAEFKTAVSRAYADRSVGFLWIKNIWKQDTIFVDAKLTKNEYLTYANKTRLTPIAEIPDDPETEENEYRAAVLTYTNEELGAQYETIIGAVDKKHKRDWNGLFILVILSGAVTWVSAHINQLLLVRKQKEKKAEEAKLDYSMRDAKNKLDPTIPQIDPAMAGKIMKIVLPAIMVMFTMMYTSALALYIITGSVVSTLMTYGLNYPVDKLLALQERRKTGGGKTGEPDKTTINPHTKYFRR
jgi:membrane protein insertase Oxa1/YidC/SpoIIIJ